MKELCCKYNIFDVIFYIWCKKFGGMEVLEVCWLKMVEDENVRFKKLLVEFFLDNEVLKVVFNWKYWLLRISVRLCGWCRSKCWFFSVGFVFLLGYFVFCFIIVLLLWLLIVCLLSVFWNWFMNVVGLVIDGFINCCDGKELMWIIKRFIGCIGRLVWLFWNVSVVKVLLWSVSYWCYWKFWIRCGLWILLWMYWCVVVG